MNGLGSRWVVLSTVTWRSSMASSRADWVFGEARLISSPRTTLAKMPPGRKVKDSRLAVVHGDAGHVGRQQVGRELDPVPFDVDGAGQRLGQTGLADAGHVLDQQVALGDQADQRQPDGLTPCPGGRGSTLSTTASKNSAKVSTVRSATARCLATQSPPDRSHLAECPAVRCCPRRIRSSGPGGMLPGRPVARVTAMAPVASGRGPPGGGRWRSTSGAPRWRPAVVDGDGRPSPGGRARRPTPVGGAVPRTMLVGRAGRRWSTARPRPVPRSAASAAAARWTAGGEHVSPLNIPAWRDFPLRARARPS